MLNPIFRFVPVFVATAMIVTPALGQGFRRNTGAMTARFIEPPRSIRQAIRNAREAIEAERFAEAVVTLGDLAAGSFDDSPSGGQDYVVIDDQNSSLHDASLMRQVRDLIGDLPPAGMELYRLRYDAAAKRDLQTAAENRDFAALGEVRRQYFHTHAGYDATAILAVDRWLSGHAIETALLLTDLVESEDAVEHLGPEIVQLHQRAMAIVAAGNDKSLTDDAMDYQTLPPADDHYRMFGGTADRNGIDGGQFPLANLRYDIETTASPRQSDLIRQTASTLTSSRRMPPPSWMPIRVGDQLLVRTTERLLGVDYKTGKTIWTYPWLSPYEEFDDETVNPEADDDGGSILRQRVWDDVPYGHVSSDGNAVFMIDNLDNATKSDRNPMQMQFRGMSQINNRGNTLVALELASEGKLLWRLGRDAQLRLTGPAVDDPLSTAFFLGPPLPVDGRLYVMVEVAGDINLMCLDPKTGGTIWQQTLVSVESGGVESDRTRRISGASCSYHEGVLICPTGAGAIVAVDIIDRTIRWAKSYPRTVNAMRIRSSQRTNVSTSGRWDASLAVIDGTRVLLTAAESDRLYGMNLIDGQPLFEDKTRVRMRYLAGIKDDRFILVGPRQMVCYQCQDGNSVWSIPRDALPDASQICGRGVFADDAYFVPTTDNDILKISLDDGSILQRRRVSYPLGNLACVDGEVISAGSTRLVVAYGDKSLRPIIAERLREDPNDFAALVRQGELFLLDGDRQKALQFLSRARNLRPNDVEVRLLSVQAMLDAMREDDQTDDSIIESLDHLIIDPIRRISFTALRLQQSIDAGNIDQSLDFLIDLSTRVLPLPPDQTIDPTTLATDDPVDRILHDAWIEARSIDLIKQIQNDPKRDDYLIGLDRRLESLTTDSTAGLLRRRRHLGPLASAIVPSKARWLIHELIDATRQNGSLLSLERLVFGSMAISRENAQKIDADAIDRLCQRYQDDGLFADAQRLRGEPVDRAPLSSFQLPSMKWPSNIRVNRQIKEPTLQSMDQSLRISRVMHGHGLAMRHVDVAGRAVHPMLIRYATGEQRMVNLNNLPPDEVANRTTSIDGGAMVSLVGGFIVGSDLYSVDIPGPRLELRWSLPVVPDGTPAYKRRVGNTPFGDLAVRYTMNAATAARGFGELALGPIVGDRFYLLRGGRLAAIDVMSGVILWQRTISVPSGQIVADDRHVAVVSPMHSMVQYFAAGDGAAVGKRKWDEGDIWQTAGPHVLTHQPSDVPSVYTVKLIAPMQWLENGNVDRPATDTVEIVDGVQTSNEAASATRMQSDVWQAGASGSKQSGFGRVIDGRLLVMMQSSGQTFAWDLLRGESIFDVTLDPVDMFNGLNVIDYGDRLALLMSREYDRAPPNGEKWTTSQANVHREVSMVRMVRRDDGNVIWERSFDRPWGVTVDQPAGSPLLVLSRGLVVYGVNNRKTSLDISAIRVDNGETASQIDAIATQTTKNDLLTTIIATPLKSWVDVEVGLQLLRFTFSDQPLADQPLADQPMGNKPLGGDENAIGGDGDEDLQPPQLPVPPPLQPDSTD